MPAKIPLEKVPGFQVAAVKTGIKPSGTLDFGMIVAPDGATAAGVFSKNRILSPAVTISKRHLNQTKGQTRAVLVNSGNANCCTGQEGRDNARASAKQIADLIGSEAREVLLCSTGVIGQQLDMTKLLPGITAAHAQLGDKPRAGQFGRAILTTDLVEKNASTRVILGKKSAVISGVAKGSGMIAPNMATMLAFVLTDAAVSAAVLRHALRAACDETFNCLTIDTDCSTNDTVLLLASGSAGGTPIREASGKRYEVFAAGVYEVCLALAEQIARDGEGATKLVRVQVTGARSKKDARRAARSIAESPLVKTAMFGNDPNWGRILMALGKSGAMVQEAKTIVRLCGTEIFREGTPLPFDAKVLSKKMQKKEVILEVDLGLKDGACQFLTCDYSYDYIRINAEYTT